MTSPRLTPIRYVMRRSEGMGRLRPAMAVWIATAHSTARTALGKSGEQTISGGVDNRSPELADHRQHLSLVCLEIADRCCFILTHEPRVARYVSRKDGRKPPFRGAGRGRAVGHRSNSRNGIIA